MQISRSLISYYADISRRPCRPLSAERERALAIRIRHGDIRARNDLVRSCVRFVAGVAGVYQSSGVPLEDLISAGNRGLIHAAEKFDPHRGMKFVSYAVWWIRNTILAEIAASSRAVVVPLHRSVHIHRLRNAIERAEQNLRRQVFLDDLPKDLACAYALDMPSLRLDSQVAETDDSTIGDNMRCEGGDDSTESSEVSELLSGAISELPDRERKALCYYYGVGTDGVILPLDDIAAGMDITRERVRQLREQALKRLRRNMEIRRLKEYV
jgi:RNA polymerase primary sigma factor